MKSFLTKKTAALLGGFLVASSPAHATITFTGGSADINIFYNSVADSWDVVLRNKGTTVATGLDNVYSGFNGSVGNNANDFTFDTLQVNVSSPNLVTFNSVSYYLAPANGSPFFDNSPTNPDLGIRTRLRENEVELGIGSNTQADQFDSVNFTLRTDLSTMPGELLILHWLGTDPVFLTDTNNDVLTSNWDAYDHVHRNFGFSQIGDYTLVFDINGVGGTYGDDASTGTLTMNFNVVPEPSSVLLGMLAVAAAGLRRKR